MCIRKKRFSSIFSTCRTRTTAQFRIEMYSNRKTGPGELVIEAIDDVRVSGLSGLIGSFIYLCTYCVSKPCLVRKLEY